MGAQLTLDWARHSFYSTRSRRRLGTGAALLVVPAFLLILFAPLISRLLAMAVSRQREYLADRKPVAAPSR